MAIIPIARLTHTDVSPVATVVFGGTFDPIHEGHLLALERLLEFFSKVIIAPTAANPWKDAQPTELSIRLEMVELAVQAECPHATRVEVYRKPYRYAEEVVTDLRDHLPTGPSSQALLWWAVGEDISEEVDKWRNWKSLDIPVVVLPIEPMVHASDIRKGLHAVLPCLEQYAIRNKLYGLSD